nr:endonuclease/exonuclease/phosphatase family protein [Planctomycetota bacterium]
LTPLVAYLLLVRRIRRAGVVVAVAAWAALPTLWWSTPDRTARADTSPLRVLSMNLGGDLAADAEVMRLIDDKDPELVLLLEYTPERKRTLGSVLEATHPHVHAVARSDNFGIAVFSKRPWTSLDVFNLARTGTPQLRIEMDVGGAPLVVYGIHVRPPIVSQYVRHRAELADLLQRLERERRPCIAMGDFNFVEHGPFGAAMHARGFYTAHAISGRGRGASWPVHSVFRYVPGIRIDHVYIGPGLTSVEAWTGPDVGSDHLPVGARIVRTANRKGVAE